MKRSDSDHNFMDRFSDISMSCSKLRKLSNSRERDESVSSGCHRSLSKSSRASQWSSTSNSSSVSSISSQRSLDYFAESKPPRRERRNNSSPRNFRTKLTLEGHNPHVLNGSDNDDELTHRISSNSYSYQHDDDDSITSLSTHSSLSSSSFDRRRSCSPPHKTLGVLPMEYWERSPDCREAKLDHMEKMDHFCGDEREYLILQTTLWKRFHTLERNMFPYDTPAGIEHWTLWCREEMSPQDVCDYVNKWLCKHMPHVQRWNYDDNSGDRSIELFHVHIYIETDPHRNAESRASFENGDNIAHLVGIDSGDNESSCSSDSHTCT